MRVRTVGKGDRTVFLHATLANASLWEDVLERMPRAHEAWVFDLPDHAEDEPGMDLPAFEQAVIDGLRTVPPPFRLVGWSLSGYLVARLLPALGSSVSAAVILGGYASLPIEVARAYTELADTVESKPEDAGALLAGVLDGALGPSVTPAHRAQAKAALAAWPISRVLRALRRVPLTRARPATQRFETPLTIVHANDDASIPVGVIEELAMLSASSRTRILETGGHALPLTEPDLVASVAFGVEAESVARS